MSKQIPHKNSSQKRNLTKRQEQIHVFIKNTIKEAGYPPTVREIASHLNIVSLHAVRRHLQALETKGCIKVFPRKSRGIQLIIDEDFSLESKEASIPLVGRIAAGPLSSAIEDIEGRVIIDPDLWGSPESLFMLRVKGDSMEPFIENGDLVVVKRQPYADPGDIVAAIIHDEATVKQLLIKDRQYILHPLNPSYEDILVDENFRINGKIIGLMRKY